MKNYDHLCLRVIRWTTMTNIRAENVVDRFMRMNLSSEKTTELLSDMKARLSVLEARSFLFMIISILTNIFLFVGVYFPERDVSILEISSQDLASVKEVSLFVSSTVLMASTLLSFNASALSASLKKMYFFNNGREGELAASNVIPGSMFGSENASGLHRDEVFVPSPIGVALKILPFILILYIVLYVCFSIFVQLFIISDVICNPTSGKMFSWAVVIYSVICSVIFLCMSVLHQIPLPCKRYNNKFFDYMKEMGGVNFNDYCISSVVWRKRLRLNNVIVFLFSINIVACVFLVFISKVVWKHNFEVKILSIVMLFSVILSVIVGVVFWREKIKKYIADNQCILHKFDVKYYDEWKARDQTSVPE